jgi:hypothetical protein
LVLPTVLTMAACGAGDASPDETRQQEATSTMTSSPDPTTPSEPSSSTSSPPPVTGGVPTELLDEIIADAAERVAVAVADVEVVRAEAVTWPDGSLGCPEPGMAYTQALVPGYWVVVDADGEELDYRVGRNGSFRLCENPTTTVPPGAGAGAD